MAEEMIAVQKIATFLRYLSKWVLNNRKLNYKNILLILNNCSIQKSKEVNDQIKQLYLTVMYLPVYSPIYAPIENYFGIIESFFEKEMQRLRYQAKSSTQLCYDLCSLLN